MGFLWPGQTFAFRERRLVLPSLPTQPAVYTWFVVLRRSSVQLARRGELHDRRTNQPPPSHQLTPLAAPIGISGRLITRKKIAVRLVQRARSFSRAVCLGANRVCCAEKGAACGAHPRVTAA